MVGHGSKFPRKKLLAITALLTHGTIKDAARSVGLSENTLSRWLRNEEFQKSFYEAKRGLVEQATARIRNCMTEAVEVLRSIMNDSIAPCSSRVSAAKSLIEIGLKAEGVEELESRISALEKQVLRKNFTQ